MSLKTENVLKNPLLSYVRMNKKSFFWGMFFLLITNFLDALYPLIFKKALDDVSNKVSIHELFVTTLLFFSIMASLAITRYFWRSLFGAYHTNAAEDIRRRLYSHLTSMDLHFFTKHPTGELMSTLTNDVQSFRFGIGPGLLILVDGISIVIILIPMMIYLNSIWTLKTMIFLPLIPFLIWFVNKKIFKNHKFQQEKLAALSALTQEYISGVRTIKSFNQISQHVKLYNLRSKDLESASNKAAFVDALFIPVMHLGITLGTVVLLFIAIDDIKTGIATIGTFVAFQRYIIKMVWPMTALGMGLSQMQKGWASFARIKEILSSETEIPDLGLLQISEFHSLEIKNLSYSYPEVNHKSLDNISFRIESGDKLAIIGTVGSGKSTLISLICRLFHTPNKSIFINDIPIENISQKSLHKILTLIPQENFLFSDSIIRNIQYGLSEESDLSLNKVEKYSDQVQLSSEISSFPQQYNSMLGEKGVNLSGGQKQRLSIARGLILNSPVIIFDDSLSAVDTKTEQAIKDNLSASESSKKTQIIIAHRLSSLSGVNKILVLSNGKVEAFGSFEQIQKTSPTLQEMIKSQSHIHQGASL